MPYEVVGLLGRGGMAVVELAIDGDGRRVARKRLPLAGSMAEMDLARRRLRREAQVLARLEHPGIVPLLAVEDDGTDVILVMPALAASLADRVRTEGPLSPAEVWRIGEVLLDALGWAHRQSVVHRDIKPANVLFDAEGRPALADFGIARSADLTHGLTLAGSLLGTPAFIAPEQARGEPAGPHSDVFSLAATLCYALTGQGPYGDADAVTLALRASRGEIRSSLQGVPHSLAGPLRSMLDPRPERRPSAAALLGGPNGTQPGGVRTEGGRRQNALTGGGVFDSGAGGPTGGGPGGPGRPGPGRPGDGRPGGGRPGDGGPGDGRLRGGGSGDVPGLPETSMGLRRRTLPPAPVVIPGLGRTGLWVHPAPVLPAAGRNGQLPEADPTRTDYLMGRADPTRTDHPTRRPRPPSPDTQGPSRPGGAGSGQPRRLSRRPGRRVVRATARVLTGGPILPRRHSRRLLALAVGILLAGGAAWTGLALAGGTTAGATALQRTSTSPSTTICAPLPYEGCGQTAAPHTDGLRCDAGWYDMDGKASNGCEAAPDTSDHQRLVAGRVVLANLVPVGEVDTYPLHVHGESLFSFSCGGTLKVTLTAPPGVTDEVQVLKGLNVEASAQSSDGRAATASVSRSSCFGNGGDDFTVAVRSLHGSTGANYTLTRNSGW